MKTSREIGTIYSFLDLENQGGNCKCLELRIICNMFDVKEIDPGLLGVMYWKNG